MTIRKTKPKAAPRPIIRKTTKPAPPKTTNARSVQTASALRYQARPYHRDAANIGWRDDCIARRRN